MSIAAAVVLHSSRSSDAHSYVCSIQPIAVFLMHRTQPVHGREWESGFQSYRICSSCGLQQDNKRTHNRERCSRRRQHSGSVQGSIPRAARQSETTGQCRTCATDEGLATAPVATHDGDRGSTSLPLGDAERKREQKLVIQPDRQAKAKQSPLEASESASADWCTRQLASLWSSKPRPPLSHVMLANSR